MELKILIRGLHLPDFDKIRYCWK